MPCMFISWTVVGDSRQYPLDVETALKKAGNNRRELEKVLDYFIKKGDQQINLNTINKIEKLNSMEDGGKIEYHLMSLVSRYF